MGHGTGTSTGAASLSFCPFHICTRGRRLLRVSCQTNILGLPLSPASPFNQRCKVKIAWDSRLKICNTYIVFLSMSAYCMYVRSGVSDIIIPLRDIHTYLLRIIAHRHSPKSKQTRAWAPRRFKSLQPVINESKSYIPPAGHMES